MTEKLEKSLTKRASKRTLQRTTKRAIKQIMKRTVAGFLALLLLMNSPATMQGFASTVGTNSDSNTGQVTQGEDILSGELKQYGEAAGENIEIGKVENDGIAIGEAESDLDAQINTKTVADMDIETETETDLQEETLAAAPANPVHHCTKSDDYTDDPMHYMDYTDYTDFSYIYFGSYPQSEVTDSATIAAIDSAIATSGTAADAGIDVWVNDTKYRRISEDDCNNTNYFNNVENDGYRYFKWERIKWRVLDNNDNGTLFVMADSALDCKCYNDAYVNITWEKSTIRSWLNGSFYQMAFSSDEQSAITQWKIVNKGNPEDGTEGGNDTTDRVYLLPVGEMTNEGYGFCSGSDTWSGSRQTQPSEYAHARGVKRDISTWYEGNCWWWLRSPGGCNMNAAAVADKGYVDSNGAYVDDDFTCPGVAPVLHIDLSSDFWSVEDDENSDEGDGTSTGGNENEKPSNPQPEPSQSKYSGIDGDLDWTIDPEGHLIISGTGDYKSKAWLDYSDEIKSATVQVTGITSTSYMFDSCSNLSSLDVSGLDTGNVTDMNCMFRGCSNLSSLDVSGFNTGSVTRMEWMFEDCSSLSSLDINGFDTSNVTDMLGMFSNCSSLSSLDVSGFNTRNVTDMRGMFEYCKSLSSLDVSRFNTGNVTDMRGMFENCSSLSSLDVSGFSTSNVTNMEGMFLGCGSLSSLDVSGFDTSNVTDMSGMFSNCSSLSSLDVSGFNTSNVTDMRSMFDGCSSLSSLDVSGFDTSNTTAMSWMFSGCSSLGSLDVSGFDTSNVMHMSLMFSACSSLSCLDISGFDMSNVTSTDFMFTWCVNLTTLTLPANIRQFVKLPCDIYDSVADEYVESDSFVWLDSNGQTCEYAIMNLPTKMTYKKVATQPTGTHLTASQVTSRTDTVPQGASFTITSSNPSNLTVSFDGVSNENATAVVIPKAITYNGVEYKVTTVSPTAFSTKKDNAKFNVTDNRVESLTVEYKAPSNAKKTKVTVPETTTYKGIKFKVTSVAAKSFRNNKKVTQISIASSITKIGDSCFEGCTALKSVTIGKGAVSIGKNAFKNCKKLTKITIKSTKLKTVGKNALKGVNAKCKIKVPKKQLKKYQTLFKKKGQKSSVKLVK